LNDLLVGHLILSLYVLLSAEVKVLFLKPEEEKDKTHFTDKEVNMAGLC